MPVDALHAEVLEHLDPWQTIRDCLKGRSAILAGGRRYVEPLDAHRSRPDQYRTYIERGTWLGATARSLDAMAGQIWRKDCTLVLPRRLQYMIEDANRMGDGLQTFAKKVTREVLSVGRAIVMVDRDVDGGLPYFVLYKAEQLVNWRLSPSGTLEQVVLKEFYEKVADDGFGTVGAHRYRVLQLDETGTYIVRLFVQAKDRGEYLEVETFTPRPTGRTIDYLPVAIINATSLGPNVEKPPLADLAEMNISHFRSSVSLENGRHMLAHPVPFITGVDGDNCPVWDASPGSVWMLPMGATVGLLEFRGDGLQSLERALAEKAGYMAVLGARLLEEPRRMVESAEALSIRQAAETASLSSIARSVSDGLTQALKISADWERDGGECAVELNQDFADKRLAPQDIRELVAAYQSGVLPLEDLLWSLQQGELLRPGRSISEVAEDLKNQPVALLGQAVELDEAAD